LLDGNDYNLRAVTWKGRRLGNGRENAVTLAVDDGRLVYHSVNRQTRERESWQPRDIRPVARETGNYRATETLAGVRMQVSLEDLPAAISLVTTEILADVSEGDDAGNVRRGLAPQDWPECSMEQGGKTVWRLTPCRCRI